MASNAPAARPGPARRPAARWRAAPSSAAADPGATPHSAPCPHRRRAGGPPARPAGPRRASHREQPDGPPAGSRQPPAHRRRAAPTALPDLRPCTDPRPDLRQEPQVRAGAVRLCRGGRRRQAPCPAVRQGGGPGRAAVLDGGRAQVQSPGARGRHRDLAPTELVGECRRRAGDEDQWHRGVAA
jgi:hypothetical protein